MLTCISGPRCGDQTRFMFRARVPKRFIEVIVVYLCSVHLSPLLAYLFAFARSSPGSCSTDIKPRTGDMLEP